MSRRRAKRPATPALSVEELVERFGEMQAEGKGRWKLSIVSGPDVLRALLGVGLDEDMVECLGVIGPALRQLADGERPDFSCLLCGDNLGGLPFAFVVLRAFAFGPQTAMLGGLCVGCSHGEDVLGKVLAFYKKNIIRDLRVVPVVEMPAGKQ